MAASAFPKGDADGIARNRFGIFERATGLFHTLFVSDEFLGRKEIFGQKDMEDVDAVAELGMTQFFRAGAAQHGASKECAERGRDGRKLGVVGAKPYNAADERGEWESGEEPSQPEIAGAEEELFEAFGALSGVVFIAHQTGTVALVEFAQPKSEIRDLSDARRVGRRWDGCGWTHGCWRF